MPSKFNPCKPCCSCEFPCFLPVCTDRTPELHSYTAVISGFTAAVPGCNVLNGTYKLAWADGTNYYGDNDNGAEALLELDSTIVWAKSTNSHDSEGNCDYKADVDEAGGYTVPVRKLLAFNANKDDKLLTIEPPEEDKPPAIVEVSPATCFDPCPSITFSKGCGDDPTSTKCGVLIPFCNDNFDSTTVITFDFQFVVPVSTTLLLKNTGGLVWERAYTGDGITARVEFFDGYYRLGSPLSSRVACATSWPPASWPPAAGGNGRIVKSISIRTGTDQYDWLAFDAGQPLLRQLSSTQSKSLPGGWKSYNVEHLFRADELSSKSLTWVRDGWANDVAWDLGGNCQTTTGCTRRNGYALQLDMCTAGSVIDGWAHSVQFGTNNAGTCGPVTSDLEFSECVGFPNITCQPFDSEYSINVTIGNLIPNLGNGASVNNCCISGNCDGTPTFITSVERDWTQFSPQSADGQFGAEFFVPAGGVPKCCGRCGPTFRLTCSDTRSLDPITSTVLPLYMTCVRRRVFSPTCAGDETCTTAGFPTGGCNLENASVVVSGL